MCISRFIRRAALLALLAAAGACGNDALAPGGTVATVTVDPSTPVVTVGSELPLTATLKDSHGTVLTGMAVHWSSSDPTIAAVSELGVVSGVALGSAQIVASSQGTSGLATVTVGRTPVASVVVTPEDANATVGSTLELHAVTYDASGNVLDGRTVIWSSSNQDVATVNDDGRVTALAEGDATITATSEGHNGTASVTVKPVPVGRVELSPSSATVDVGETVDLDATVRDANGKKLDDQTVAWSSSDDDVATVSSSGKVTGVRPGNVTITASAAGKSATAAVSVKRPAPVVLPVSKVDVTPSSPTIRIGATVQLHATLKDENGNTLTDRPIEWHSSDEDEATVSSTGLVRGIDDGTVTITATSEGKTGSAKVKVDRHHVHDVKVSLEKTSLEVGQTALATATLFADDGSVLTDFGVAWSSSDDAVVTVSNEGLVHAVKAGSATIVAASDGQNGTASVSVRDPPAPDDPTANPPDDGGSNDDGGTQPDDPGKGKKGDKGKHGKGKGGHN
jgi:uncharacterized protein YjdB